MSPTSHRPELDLLRRQVADLARELAERDRVLHEQTRHLEIAQALAHLGSWNWDVASGAVEWSDELYRIFGYEPRSRAITFDSFVSAVLPDDHDQVLASIDDALAGVALYDMECRIVRPDGDVRTIHCCGEVTRDNGGQPLRMSGTALDITDRKRAELALQQREAHFRALLEHSSDVITVLNLDGTIWFESPSIERVLGYAQYELNGRSAFEFVHHEDLPDVTEKLRLLVQQPGTPQLAEFRFRHKNGSWRHFEGIGRVIHDSDGRGSVIVNSRDITERKRAEAMLRTSQEKLRQALRASGIGLWDWNTDTDEVAFSEEWKRQLGYEPAEIVDSFEAWTTLLHPDDHDAAMAYARDYVSRREGDYRQEFRLKHKDGEYRWIEARASFVTEADSRQIRLLGAHTDITDRKLMEHSVRESEEWYRTLVELSPSGVFVFSEGKTAYVNHTGAVLLGAQAAQEILDRPTFEFIHSDYHQEVRENVRRLLSGGVSVHSAERIYLKMDGTPIPVQVEAARITWNGKPAILGLFSDITERKRAEESLRASEELFFKAFRSSPDPMVLSELETGLCLDVNDACLTGFGYRREDVVGRTGDTIGHWQSLEHRRRFVEQLQQKGVIRNLEAPFRTASGEMRECLVSAELIEYHGKSCMITVGKDITERKQAEQALRESEERFAKAFRASPHPIGITEVATGRCIEVNDACLQLFGFRREEVIGNTTLLLGIWPKQEDRARLVERLKAGEPARNLELSFRTKSDDVRHIIVSSDLAELNGTLCLITVGSDITERKQAEQTLWKSQQAIRALHDISSAQGHSFKERVEALLQLGCRFFDLPIGMETVIQDEEWEVKQVNAPGMAFYPGMRVPLSQTYCSEVFCQNGPVCCTHAGASPEWQQHPAYAALQLESYIGTAINGLVRTYGTLCFASVVQRTKPFTDSERDFIQLMAQWLGGELDRQSTLDALRQSEERYRTLYDETPSMYFTVDGTGVIRSINQYGAQYLGYRAQDLVGKWVATILFEEDRERIWAEMDAFFRHPEGVAQWELRKVRRDGSVLWVRELARVVQSRDGEPLALIVCEDITERKQTEKALADLNATLERQVCERTQALRQSEERFRQFFDNAPNVTALKDHHGRYVYTNRQFDKIFGFSPGHAIGKMDGELFSPEQAAQFQSHDQQVLLNGREREFEEITQQEDGPHTSIVVKFPVTDAAGHLSALGLIATDVTERNRVQEALRESQARWQQFAESVGSAFWIADMMPDERKVVLYVNSAFTCIWGIEREEIYQNWSLWLDSIHPDDRTRVQASYDRFVQGGATAVFHREYRIVGRDGHIRWISDRRVRMTGWEHRIAGIAEDITHHKQQLALMAQTEAIGKIGGWEFDFLTNRLSWSDETYRLHETAPELYVPTVETALEFYTAESRPMMAEAWRKGVTEGQSWDLEVELISVKGRRIAVRAAGKVDVLEGRAVRAYGTFQDITERKRAEEALRRAHDELERKVAERTAELQTSEDRYARATAIGKVGVWELDVAGGQYHGDTNLKALFGYDAEELSTDPLDWLRLVHPDDQSIAMKNWELVQSGEVESSHYELRHIKKDGSLVWGDVRAHAVRGQNGQLTHLIGATVDITERKQAERALRESEERFAKAFRTSPHPIGITEVATGRCIEVNDACLELFGFCREEVIGNTTLMLGIWPNLEDRVRVIERLKAGQPVRNMEFALRVKSGAVRYLLASADLAELNGTLCIVTVANDITDRKQAEEALRMSEERFAKAFQASPHPVVISELDSGRVIDANEAACQLFGYRKDEVVGRTTLQIALWHSVEERALYLERLKHEGSVRNVEVNLRGRNGDVRQCLLSSELIILNGKQCSVTVGDDITESKRLEKALRLTQFSVDQAVEAILWLDPRARIFSVNDTACHMLEYSRQDLMAMTVHDIDPNFPVERWANHWTFLKQQGALTFEATFWSRIGSVVETDVTVNYLQHEGKEYACMILRDIGERKRAEAELHRSHTFLRQVIDTDPDLIFAKDRDGRFVVANKAVADWYGTTVDTLIGKSDSDFNANAEEVEFFRQSDLEVFNSGRDRFIPEERITDVGGRMRWLQTVKRPIYDDQGQVHLVLGAATDITERKRMEEILLQRERDLSAALEERERISQDLHDGILQSLYAVGLGLEGCKPLIRKKRDPVAEKFMATLDQAIGQLNQVMTEVRNFIAGLESQVLQGGDFSTALRTMIETMSISSSAKCRVKIDDAAARRLSTEQALHIINIVREGVSNALRHSRAKQITVSLRDLIRSDRLAVTDDGIGFNTRSVHGVGHGLVNMAARAQKVRGLFAIQSKPDKGTRISLDLPKDTHHAHN